MTFGLWGFIVKLAQIITKGRAAGLWKNGQGPVVRDPRNGPK